MPRANGQADVTIAAGDGAPALEILFAVFVKWCT
jgi:hypothetical protein